MAALLLCVADERPGLLSIVTAALARVVAQF
jgi:hypothetical protein